MLGIIELFYGLIPKKKKTHFSRPFEHMCGHSPTSLALGLGFSAGVSIAHTADSERTQKHKSEHNLESRGRE